MSISKIPGEIRSYYNLYEDKTGKLHSKDTKQNKSLEKDGKPGISEEEVRDAVMRDWDIVSNQVRKAAEKEWGYLSLGKFNDLEVNISAGEILGELGLKTDTISVNDFVQALKESPADAYRKSEYVLEFLKLAGFEPEAAQKSIEGAGLLFTTQGTDGSIKANCLELSTLAVSMLRAAGVQARLLETVGFASTMHMQVLVSEKDAPKAVLDLYDDLEDNSVLKVVSNKKELEPGQCYLTKTKLHFWDKDDSLRTAKMHLVRDPGEEKAIFLIDQALVRAKQLLSSADELSPKKLVKELNKCRKTIEDNKLTIVNSKSFWQERIGKLDEYLSTLEGAVKAASVGNSGEVDRIAAVFDPTVHAGFVLPISFDVSLTGSTFLSDLTAKDAFVRQPGANDDYFDAVENSVANTGFVQYFSVRVPIANKDRVFDFYAGDPDMPGFSKLGSVKAVEVTGDTTYAYVYIPMVAKDPNLISKKLYIKDTIDNAKLDYNVGAIANPGTPTFGAINNDAKNVLDAVEVSDLSGPTVGQTYLYFGTTMITVHPETGPEYTVEVPMCQTASGLLNVSNNGVTTFTAAQETDASNAAAANNYQMGVLHIGTNKWFATAPTVNYKNTKIQEAKLDLTAAPLATQVVCKFTSDGRINGMTAKYRVPSSLYCYQLPQVLFLI